MTQTYDETLYEGQSHPESHPDHLYAVGRFMGLNPPDFQTARVLEIGAGCGINALSMAMRFPSASILAVDLSHEQIKYAEARASALNLSNLKYAVRSLEDITPDDGAFDYIICYGLYSWIAESLHAPLLQCLHDHLSPSGLAFVNYNVLPGWGTPNAVRELTLFHQKLRPQTRDLAFVARDAAALLGDGLRTAQGDHVAGLRREIQHIKRSPDYYLVHEYLSPENHPVYFHEFMAKVDAAGLAYVGDAYVDEMYPTDMPPRLQKRLQGLGSIEQSEQYLDFMRGRRFRSSILCRSEENLPNHRPVAERCKGLWISCYKSDDGHSSASDSGVQTWPPVLQAALSQAKAHDRQRISITAEGVTSWAQAAGVSADALDEALAIHLIDLILSRIVELHGSCPPRPDFLAGDLSYCPQASRLVRLQISAGQRWVSSLSGNVVNLDKRSQTLLHLMNGKRNLTAITEAFIATLQKSGWVCMQNGERLDSEAEIFEVVASQVAQAIETYRQNNLLEA